MSSGFDKIVIKFRPMFSTTFFSTRYRDYADKPELWLTTFMPLFWTLITFLISLLMLSPVVKSQQNENMNDYEEPEIPVDEAYFDAQKQPEQNYEYQDESAFIKDAQSWRKVIQKQASYAVKDKPEGAHTSCLWHGSDKVLSL